MNNTLERRYIDFMDHSLGAGKLVRERLDLKNPCKECITYATCRSHIITSIQLGHYVDVWRVFDDMVSDIRCQVSVDYVIDSYERESILYKQILKMFDIDIDKITMKDKENNERILSNGI